MTEWKIQGSRVYGNGQSYNCTNRVTAEQLQATLNQYETTVNLQSNIEQQFDKITRELIQVKMTLSMLNSEIQTLSGDINALNEAK